MFQDPCCLSFHRVNAPARIGVSPITHSLDPEFQACISPGWFKSQAGESRGLSDTLVPPPLSSFIWVRVPSSREVRLSVGCNSGEALAIVQVDQARVGSKRSQVGKRHPWAEQAGDLELGFSSSEWVSVPLSVSRLPRLRRGSKHPFLLREVAQKINHEAVLLGAASRGQKERWTRSVK